MTETAVETRSLTKTYGRRTVVDALDLHLPLGVVAGFIGPNGAGKSTTLRMLLGLVRPSSGTGTVLGRPLDRPQDFLAEVGALIEAPAFYPGLSGEANLRVLATLGGDDADRIPAVLERVGLAGRGADRYASYSLGMKQRLGIAAALLGDPRLLVLDEPTNGLDPDGIRDVRDLVRSLADEGLTVLVSSHLLAELEQVCDHLVVVERGKEVFQGPTSALLAGGDALLLAPEHPADLGALGDLLRRHGLEPVREGDRLRVPAATDPAGVNRAAAEAGIVLAELHVTRASLEQRYGSLVGAGR